MNISRLRRLIDRAWMAMKWKKTMFVALLVFGLVMVPLSSHGQLGLDPCCAIISAGLNAISGLLKSVVAKPLSQIQQIEQQSSSFEQQVVFPTTAINNARSVATQLQAQMGQINQLFRLPVNSATLPTPQQLEQSLLSHNPQSLAQVSQNYGAVYGTVMAPTDAPQPVRDLVDMSDAEAQAALKKAVELDALADVELAVADQINKQIQTAAPGSAPILEAQASAWLVRANAYTQSAMAEVLRVRSIDLANSGAQFKFNATDVNTLRNNTGQAMGHGAQ
jgi:hypothetical protein